MSSADEDEKKKRSINEMFGDDDSDDDADTGPVHASASAAPTADASGLFGSDSESDDEPDRKPAKAAAPAPTKSKSSSSSKKRRTGSESRPASARDDTPRRAGAGGGDSGDDYDSGDDVVRTRDDDAFIDNDDDLADVLDEYNDDAQKFDDERPLPEDDDRVRKEADFFEDTLKSLKTGRGRRKMLLSVQEQEQIVQELLYRMDKAHADDLASMAKRTPALERVKYVDEAIRVLRKQQLQPTFLDFDLLSFIKKWIQPLEDGTLPNLGVRTKMLQMVARLPVMKEHLKRSGFGKVVMLLWKHPQETRENKDLCRDLIERWSRAVFDKTLDYSKLAELEAEKAENLGYRRPDRRQSQTKATASTSRGSDSANPFLGRSSEPREGQIITERAIMPQALRVDFVHRPQPKVDLQQQAQQKVETNDNRKTRLSKRMQEIARPGRKAKRAVTKVKKPDAAGIPASHVVKRPLSSMAPIHPPHNVVLPSSSTSVLHKHDDHAMPDYTINQWGDHDTTDDLHALKGVVLEGTMSQVAVLNRELKALETRYFRTREQLDKVTDRSNLLRLEMAKCRTQSDKRARENATLRHVLDRLQSEKKQLEHHAIRNRDYATKIEQRFFVGVPKAQTQTLVQCNIDLTARVKSLQLESAQRDEAMQHHLKELKVAQDNVGILKRALETRFDELQLNGSLHNGVLFELARLQDQNASMALQLGDERKTSKALEAKLEHARAKHNELEEHTVVRETWLASLETERVELGNKLAACENDRQTFAFEKATLLKFIQEQAEAKFQVEAELKRVHDAKLAELEGFHARLQVAMDDKHTLQATISELRVQLETAQVATQTLEQSYSTEQQTVDELRRRQHDMFLDIQRLQDEYKAKDDAYRSATEVGRQLQATVETQQHEAQERNAKIDELDAIVVALEQEIGQRKDEEAALRVAMENALRDLDTLSKQRNDAARAMNEAVVISASSLDEQQALEAKVETQRTQLEQLKHAKSLLQNAMLEQLTALRKQLQTERLQRIEAEAKLKQRGGGSGGEASSVSNPRSSPVTSSSEAQLYDRDGAVPPLVPPTPSYESDELQPLPPPEISMPSPLPAHIAMLQQQLPLRVTKARSSVSSASSSSSSGSDDVRESRVNGSPPHRVFSTTTRNEQTPERTTSSSSLIPSPLEHLSLLELAGDM